MTRVLLSLSAGDSRDFAGPIERACRDAGVTIELFEPGPETYSANYVVFSPDCAEFDFSSFANLKAVLSIWAGVERIVGNSTLTAPLCRMVDPGLTEGMVEYVTGHVMRHHLGLDAVLAAQQNGEWKPSLIAPIARERPVGFLGLGALGTACARALSALNFPVLGWSRRQADIAGIECHSGPDGLAEVLRRAQILVTLLPATPETGNILNAETLGLMPEGAVLINPGRGTLIDDDALLAALDNGRLAHATLDVFRTEPLPPDHPFWSHPGVTITPHIAAATRPETAATVIAENIRRGEAGEPFLHLVDRSAGY